MVFRIEKDLESKTLKSFFGASFKVFEEFFAGSFKVLGVLLESWKCFGCFAGLFGALLVVN